MAELPAPVRLVQMISGIVLTHAVHVAAELKLADHLADGPRAVADLAGVTGADSDSLYRLLRTLASV